ncbi:hypothetical protein D9758_015066 [Tetrapyrgos nigripes]|uniref:Uncharacterized protein n=1 Tax=Tetrapyrgos nigripes TaxID=182062 RepID=A0A8H5FSW9_9AGAR|nr:hypothetical protein D9758_015066 [Tetrapyrgos nigripes]
MDEGCRRARRRASKAGSSEGVEGVRTGIAFKTGRDTIRQYTGYSDPFRVWPYPQPAIQEQSGKPVRSGQNLDLRSKTPGQNITRDPATSVLPQPAVQKG